eukprot:CAMPEP_0114421146 /NCGR_PEP_ID=MMETSP0103-20121206/4924_1 /TAXON_ID=37642 ORGANISM="Paraphysomonas imperforata, Strain PA2" /NCGR_SAMPLE_ID=MMETSP0103 /ASSEMBLY_ACC=CAM_ASM_000201 /LENGTH=500 /DNA_ID=CAMNT_0001589651 /DNA_START=541 /DNA_END=2043 /DNA_ORIENTATION=-
MRQPPSKDKPNGLGSPQSLSNHSTYDSEQYQHRSRQKPTASPTYHKPPLELMSPSKPLTAGSSALENIQRDLVTLIRSQGVDGIISSELPKRFFDYFGVRLDLQDENGEKFRIKDILHNRTDVMVSMHKGVQPKYVYTGPDPCLTSRRGKGSSGEGSPASTGNSENQNRRSDEEITKQEQTLQDGSKFNLEKEFMRKHGSPGQPAFSPAGIASTSFFPTGLTPNATGHSRENYGNSPFFPESHSTGLAGSNSQENLSGLLGRSTTDTTSNTTGSGGSLYEDSFKFPFFKSDCDNADDIFAHEGAQRAEYVRVLNEKNRQLDGKSMEIEDLRKQLQDSHQHNRRIAMDFDNERRELLAKISLLSEKCVSLEKDALSRSNSDSSFPQNAFAMSSSREPFSPQRSTVSNTSSPSSPGNWMGDNNCGNSSSGISSPHYQSPGQNRHSSQHLSQNLVHAGNQCGHKGCVLEGKYLCSGCNSIGYCGAEHQAEHWYFHKNECGMFH